MVRGGNIQFDARVLKATAEHHQISLPVKPTECTVHLARNQLKITPAKLNNVCDVLKIPLKHHEALSDSLASAYIYLHAKTGEKPWLTGKALALQYELVNDDQTPITKLPRTKKKAIAKVKKLVDTISTKNSDKSKARLASLLKK